MKTTIDHLPDYKQEELENIIGIIRNAAKVEMIILFGSYARGDFVDHDFRYDAEEQHFTSYESDFDIMVIVKEEKVVDDYKIWNKVENQIRHKIHTPTKLIREDIEHVNEQLSVGRYFYADVKKEGILLYDSKRFQLARARELTPGIKKALAEEDHKIWFPKAKEYFVYYETGFEKGWNNSAAFNLHQTTEHLYTGASLVLTSYKPRTHDLEKLTERMEKIDRDFAKIFPREEGEEKRLFELLRKAYVDARYKKSYKITKSELEYLADRVKKLRRLALKKSRERIEQFEKEIITKA
ncbi:MAG: HEPN domain-containing protein [bacterium]